MDDLDSMLNTEFDRVRNGHHHALPGSPEVCSPTVTCSPCTYTLGLAGEEAGTHLHRQGMSRFRPKDQPIEVHWVKT